jgi:ATP-dependent RNA helicase DHX37/DHR1
MIVVATNVAETSVTIPSIRYVIDSGKMKRKRVDGRLGLERHFIEWISQASSEQRSGRAGRTGPGYCYRLYSSAVYVNIFQKYDPPEITESPLEQVILSMKNIGVRDIFKFPFLTCPPKGFLKFTLTFSDEICKAID